jgi:tRNA-binding protein
VAGIEDDRVTTIAFDQFDAVDMRVGRVVDARDFPKARKPAYKLWIDFGEYGIRTSSAQITGHYVKEDLIGRLVVAVTNFPPRKIADFSSEVLVLGASDGEGQIVLLNLDREVPLGMKIS